MDEEVKEVKEAREAEVQLIRLIDLMKWFGARDVQLIDLMRCLEKVLLVLHLLLIFGFRQYFQSLLSGFQIYFLSLSPGFLLLDLISFK